MKKLNAFSWYGGKYSHLDWILPLLNVQCSHFVDVFGGSAAVLLNREPSPVETYNDLDFGVVNFFRALRDHNKELVRLLEHTPYSRKEYDESRMSLSNYENLTSVEHARLFFIAARMSFSGAVHRDGCSWSFSTGRSRSGKSESVSRWLGSIEKLNLVSNRLRRVQIENDDAVNIIARYDKGDSLFYCDPPYVFSTRSSNKKCYFSEMTDEQHGQLAESLNACKSKVAVSYYDCEMINELYPVGRWHRHYATAKKIRSGKRITQEMLLTNYEVKND